MIKTQEETEMKLELKKKLNNAQEEESPPSRSSSAEIRLGGFQDT